MTHISEIIENILVEWAYRVHDGMPNPKNALHIQQLRESMEELDIPNNVIYQVIENLINEVTDEETEFKARSKETNKIIYFKNQDNLDNATNAKRNLELLKMNLEKEISKLEDEVVIEKEKKNKIVQLKEKTSDLEDYVDN